MNKFKKIIIILFLANFALPFSVFSAPVLPPVSVNARTGEQGGVLVSWQASGDSFGLKFDVYRSSSASGFGTRVARDLAGFEFLDKSVFIGRQYFYFVRATDQFGERSDPSGRVGVIVLDVVPPQPPRNVSSSARDLGEVKITWSKPFGKRISRYIVYRSTTLGFLGDKVAYTDRTSYTEYSLPGNRTYYYSVKAVDTSGNISDMSLQSEVITINANTNPLIASNVSATPNGRSGQIMVSWNNPSLSNFSHIQIYRSLERGALGNLIAENVRGNTITDRRLENGVIYYYTIETVSKGGVKYLSQDQVSASPFLNDRRSMPPSGPRYLTALDLGDGKTLRLSWTNPTASDFKHLRIYRSDDRDELGEVIANNIRTSVYLDSDGLETDVRYYYTVVSIDENGVETDEPAFTAGLPTLALLGEGGSNDASGDGLPDWWKRLYGYHPRIWDDPNQDDDNDGLGLLDEYRYGTHPWNPDSDYDGYNDGTEVANGFNPMGPGYLSSWKGYESHGRPIFAYGKPRLSNLGEEKDFALELRKQLRDEFSPRRVPNPASHWHKLVNAYVYGGYSVLEIAHTLRLGPGLVHPEIPAVGWRQTHEYARKINPL